MAKKREVRSEILSTHDAHRIMRVFLPTRFSHFLRFLRIISAFAGSRIARGGSAIPADDIRPAIFLGQSLERRGGVG